MKIKCTKFGIDKVYHALAGENAALAVVAILLLSFPVSFLIGSIAIEAAVVIVAVLKELYDALRKKTFFDPADILYTIGGSLPIVFLWWLVCNL